MYLLQGPEAAGGHNGAGGEEAAGIMDLIKDLLEFDRREGALLELSKKREMYDDLALVLWHSFGKPES